MTTDFSLKVDYRDGEEPDKSAVAVLGEGGPDIFLFSRIGDLSIRRLPVVQRAEEGGGS